MILVDANILIYAVNADAVEHRQSKAWLEAQLGGHGRVGLPWPSILAFVRIATNPAAFRPPLTPPAAWRHVQEWFDSPVAWTPVPGENHGSVLGKLMDAPLMSSRLVSDAHLAALAIEHGLTLCSTDGDFAKFPGLKWENPLAVR